ncbi:MAG: hypothetical protein ABEL51_08370 [Salinibacter sp.]
MPLVVIFMVIVIPVLATFLFAGYKEWLEFKAKHQELGPESQELQARLDALYDRIEDLEQERNTLRERVQNLETIVTSESWIAGHEDGAEASLEAAPLDELTLPDGASSENEAEHTAELARRLRGE